MLTEKELELTKKDLDSLPNILGTLNATIEAAKKELREVVEMQIKEIENELLYEVKYTMEEGTDKKKYKDDSAREKALKEKRDSNLGYQNLLERQKELKNAIFTTELKFFDYDKKFKAVRVKAELMANELRLKADLHRDFDRE